MALLPCLIEKQAMIITLNVRVRNARQTMLQPSVMLPFEESGSAQPRVESKIR